MMANALLYYLIVITVVTFLVYGKQIETFKIKRYNYENIFEDDDDDSAAVGGAGDLCAG